LQVVSTVIVVVFALVVVLVVLPSSQDALANAH
jgi:hypothetical protein